MSKKLIVISLAILAVDGGAVGWWVLFKPALPPGFAGSNGRLEAKEVEISTKYAGRIKEVLANEGATVEGGRVVH
jgi:HlyD family secretion protein